MKIRIPYILSIAALPALCASLTTGCVSTPRVSVSANGTAVTNTVSMPDPGALKFVAQEAAQVGTTLWLTGHPADRDKFELARTSLKGLIAAGSGSPADLQAALSLLPVDKLAGQNGSVLVSGAVVLIDAAGNKLTSLDKNQVWSGYVLPVALGLSAGLDAALGPPPAN